MKSIRKNMKNFIMVDSGQRCQVSTSVKNCMVRQLENSTNAVVSVSSKTETVQFESAKIDDEKIKEKLTI